MHLHWKSFPKAYKGQFHNLKPGKLATFQVEAVCNADLYWWNLFWGCPGTSNDITVCGVSLLFRNIFPGEDKMTFSGGYSVRGQKKNWHLYYLATVIYPEWAIFLKPDRAPVSTKEKAYTATQKSPWEYIEHFFDVFRERFKILRQYYYGWNQSELGSILEEWVILRNMLVKLRLSGQLDDDVDAEGHTFGRKK